MRKFAIESVHIHMITLTYPQAAQKKQSNLENHALKKKSLYTRHLHTTIHVESHTYEMLSIPTKEFRFTATERDCHRPKYGIL